MKTVRESSSTSVSYEFYNTMREVQYIFSMWPFSKYFLYNYIFGFVVLPLMSLINNKYIISEIK